MSLLSACAQVGNESEAVLGPTGMPNLHQEIHDNPIVGVQLITEFSEGTAVVALDLGYLLTSKSGQLVFVDGASQRARNLLDLSTEVSTDSERGLLGIALHPEANLLYLNLTNVDGHTEIREYPFSMEPEPNVGERFRLVLSIEQPFPEHNGGHLLFGPDGYLYIGVGDGGFDHDPFNHAQNPATLLGSILRIDPTGEKEGDYSTPVDNPFADGSGNPAVWAIGLRNPWRFWIDPTNEDLWIGDVGHNHAEEINWASRAEAPGTNFGWSVREGSDSNPHSSAIPFDGDLVDPLWTYPHEGQTCAVVGGIVYRGQALGIGEPYIFADLCIGNLWALRVNDEGQATVAELGNRVANPVSFTSDVDGEILVLSLSEGLYKITSPVAPD